MHGGKPALGESIFGKNVSPADARLLADRILASRTLERSPQLRSFFRFVTERGFDTGEAPTEYEVGVEALQRPQNYSPSDDNIVRVQARLLRQKLESYFETESPHEKLRVTIPKGSYLPKFEAVEALALLPAVGPPAPVGTHSISLSRSLWTLLLGLLVVAILWVSFRPSRRPQELFWSRVFGGQAGTWVVPSDASLVVLQSIAGNDIPLADYAGREYWHKFMDGNPVVDPLRRELASRRLTSLTSTNIVIKLAERHKDAAGPLEIQYARDIKAMNLDSRNIVLIGASHSNPWVSHFESQSRIRLRHVNGVFVGERVTDTNQRKELFRVAPEQQAQRIFGLISFIANGSRGQSALVIQGTGSTGTDAAADFLFRDSSFEKFLSSIIKNNTIPYFDLLLESKNIGGSAPTASILATEILNSRVSSQ